MPRHTTSFDRDHTLDNYNILWENCEAVDALIAGDEIATKIARQGIARIETILQIGKCRTSSVYDSISARFTKVASERADAAAIRWRGEAITYRTLELQSRHIASGLLAAGVSQNSPIALQTRRSPEMIAAVLGIMRAGCHLLFINPSCPIARQQEIMEGCDCSHIIRDNPVVGSYSFGRQYSLCDMLNGTCPAVKLPEVTAAQLAYLMFTSGSSGEPKAVTGTHRALLARLEAMWEAIPFAVNESCIFRKSFEFIGSMTELFEPLLQGIGIRLLGDDEVNDPYAIVAALSQYGTTRFWCFPSLLRIVLQVCDSEHRRLPCLKYCFSSGEALDEKTVQDFRRVFPRTFLINIYGSTEVASDVAFQLIGRTTDYHCIGRPMKGCRLYVLDQHLRPAPIGIPGELYVGGDFVSGGYHRASSADARFIQDPFTTRPGMKLFKTGDKAVLDERGRFMLLGRLNTEVKVNGFRVSLIEVETKLLSLPEIRAVGVTVCRDDRDARLVAYLDIYPDKVTSVDDLKKNLRQLLPDYMMPTEFIRVNALPLTPNGKLDRKALSQLQGHSLRSCSSKGTTVLLTSTERQIWKIWRDVLRVENVHPDETFQDAGGTSLLGFQVMAQLREQLRINISPAEFFAADSIRQLAQLVATKACKANMAEPTPVPAGKIIPFTNAQAQIWLASKLSPAAASYSMCSAVRIRNISRARLLSVLRRLFKRHGALRVRVTNQDGVTCQILDGEFDNHLELLSSGEFQGRYASLEDCCVAYLKMIPDPAGRLAKLILINEVPQQWVLCLVIHHVVCDGWSMNVLFHDLTQLLGGHRLAPLRFDYCEQILRNRQTKNGEADVEYWRERLAGVPPTSTFRPEFRRNATEAMTTDRTTLLFSVDETGRIRSACRMLNVTVNQMFVTAIGTLLARFCDQSTVVVGLPFLGRSTAAEQAAVGLFMNTIPFRMDVKDQTTFGELSAVVRRTMLADFDHGLTVASKIFAAAETPRVSGVATGFQVLFTAYDFAQRGSTAGNASVEVLDIALQRGAKLDASFSLYTSGRTLELTVDFPGELYRRESAQNWLDCLQALLLSAAEDPRQTIGDLAICGARTQAHIFSWNRTDVVRSETEGLVQRFKMRAEQAPEAIAVFHGTAKMDYATVERLSDGIAAQILARTMKTATPLVPFVMDRCLDLPATLLGILKAQRAFVPIDPRLPERFRTALLTDLGSKVVVTGKAYAETVVAAGFAPIIPAPGAPLAYPPRSRPEEPIYAIFTSGSTGRPEAAINLHRGIENRFDWMTAEFDAQAARCSIQTTHHCYDSSVWQLLWPLTLGGAVVVPENGRETDADYLRRLIAAHGVSIVDFVPSVLKALLPKLEADANIQAQLSSLREVIIGGEELDAPLAEKAKRLFSMARVVNLYGPTETSIGCIFHRFEHVEGGRIPIGRPIANTRAIVLDGSGRLCPPGMIGELHLGGACVGGGYFKQDELTARAFVRNPFPALGCETLYKTGDIAAYRPDGVLDFFGRRDRQIKIRGHRIEIGEIEAHIREVPDVCEVVLEFDSANAQGPRLLAYVVLQRDVPVDELRRQIAKRLPSYSVPAEILVCPEIPVAASGKVDWEQLRLIARDETRPTVVPNEEEEVTAIRQVWEKVLDRKVCDIGANFFDLGGHSLLIPAIFAGLTPLFPSLVLMDLFKYPTIAELARELRHRRETGLALATQNNAKVVLSTQ